VAIGAQAVGQHLGVAPVVFGTGDGEAVAEPIKLLGIDRMNLKATFQQRFNHGAVRRLDRHRDRLGLGSGADNQPVAQLADPRTVVRDGAFLATLSLASTRQT